MSFQKGRVFISFVVFCTLTRDHNRTPSIRNCNPLNGWRIPLHYRVSNLLLLCFSPSWKYHQILRVETLATDSEPRSCNPSTLNPDGWRITLHPNPEARNPSPHTSNPQAESIERQVRMEPPSCRNTPHTLRTPTRTSHSGPLSQSLDDHP